MSRCISPSRHANAVAMALVFCLVSVAASNAWGQPAGAAGRALTPMELSQHALSRLAFGPRPGEVLEVTKSGWIEWAKQQFKPDTIDDKELQERLDRECPTLKMSLEELQELERSGMNNEGRTQIKNELRMAVLLRAIYSKRQLQQVVADFWRNHLNVDVNKVPALATHYEEHVLQKHGFGKFSDLLMASAKHPAMLVYLDNFISNRTGLNENYARELMELHTLSVDNGYDQADVIALARVLSGWTCGWQGEGSQRRYDHYFDPNMHDTTAVEVVGLKVDGQGGQADGERAINYLAHHPNTANFIARKLCRYFVDDQPPPQLVEKVAKTFLDSDGDLTRVYGAIFGSPEFVSQTTCRVKFKTPFEYVVSVLRATDAKITKYNELFRKLELMGQPIYECLEPTGYGDQREAWLDPGVMVYRWNFAIELVTNKIDGVTGGEDFVAPILNSPPAKRPKLIMDLLLPGVRDQSIARLLAFTADPRAQTAYALGSPMFQQQ